ncbi:NUDIX domain-containing protein [Cesiribacter sp. SM1]|uniref:NUDIX domain-containing protein n=1 Tax=Cesiribacter sp. SM1 TaxID=2861196 RepID=UPI001CD604D6|nr:NUDIX domain-containing protein [Cesiribacter sp. SM1]
MISKYPEPTVSAIIFNPLNQVLLCKSAKWNNQYVIPGGHIEQGETMEDALRREVLEETGLKIHSIELIGLQECIYSDTFQEKRHFIFIDYSCRTDGFEVVLNDEADEWIWVGLDKVTDYDLGGYTRQFFTALKDKKSVYLKQVFYNYA